MKLQSLFISSLPKNKIGTICFLLQVCLVSIALFSAGQNVQAETTSTKASVAISTTEAKKITSFDGDTIYLGGKNIDLLTMPVTAFDHAMHSSQLSCSSCHVSVGETSLETVPRDIERNPTYSAFAKITSEDIAQRKVSFHEKCIACHNKQSSGPTLTQCRACHSIESKSSLPKVAPIKPQFDASLHERHMLSNGFPTTAKGERLAPTAIIAMNDPQRCATCHHAVPFGSNNALTLDMCQSCHFNGSRSAVSNQVDSIKTPNLQASAHETCLRCHATLAEQNKTHGPLDCSSCHTQTGVDNVSSITTSPKNVTMGRPTGLLLTNKVAPSYKPLSPLEPQGKQEPATMPSVPFNHSMHERSVPSCASCHHTGVEQPCITCHTPTGSKKGKNITLAQAMHSPTSEFSCVSCHAKKATSAPECAGCHTQKIITKNIENCAFCHRVPTKSMSIASVPTLPFTTASNAQTSSNNEARMDNVSPALGLGKVQSGLPDTVKIGAMSKDYRPVKFAHKEHLQKLRNAIGHEAPGMLGKHISDSLDCALCHHNSPKLTEGMTPPKCITCHPASLPAGVTTMPDGIPLLKAAYHQRCMDCHTRMEKEKPKANDCESCHIKRDPSEAPVW